MTGYSTFSNIRITITSTDTLFVSIDAFLLTEQLILRSTVYCVCDVSRKCSAQKHVHRGRNDMATDITKDVLQSLMRVRYTCSDCRSISPTLLNPSTRQSFVANCAHSLTLEERIYETLRKNYVKMNFLNPFFSFRKLFNFFEYE